MAYLHSFSDDAMPLDERLRRYLPSDLAEELAASSELPPERVLETYAHLTAARTTITTYLPHLLVDQLLHQRQESPWLRWVEGSLLFADLSGSTALAERLACLGHEGTELVTEFLNELFTTLIHLVQSFGGDLVAFGGDALLVLFSGRRHPRTAVRAALALQEALRGYVRSVPGVGEFPMHLHIGLESGPVACVSAGQAHALHYGVLGVTVNAVAAAEARAAATEVVVGPGMWPRVARFVQAQPVGDTFHRVTAIRPARSPCAPLPDEPALAHSPEEAIPLLLDDLDRVSPYVPPALLERILAEPQRPQIEAELRPVTVLFAQVLGLETLAEALAPRRAAQAIQILVGAMQAAVEQFGGVLNKLDVADAGLKLVAMFGAPTAYEDHPARAALAALMLMRELPPVIRRVQQLAADSTLPPARNLLCAARIGLNLGTVFAGNVGSPVRKEYTVMGDAVNVAARVMSAAPWGEVWCSAAVAEATEERMLAEPRGAIALKGKAQPLPLFRLLAEREQVVDAPADNGPLIGREAELDTLLVHLSAALHHAGRAVRVIGDAGVGKSRLVSELVEQARAQGMRVIAAACQSYTANTPYAAWAEWLRALCGIGPLDQPTARESRLSARLAALGPGMEDWLPLLGDLLQLNTHDNRLTRGLDPQLRQVRRFELLEQLLLSAADGPLLVLFEDLHWADPISLELWRRVTLAVAGRPLLLVGVHRPSPALDQLHDSASTLELRELSAEESARLLGVLGSAHTLPESLVRQIVGRASGNPLFLHELLRAVLDGHRSLDDLPDSLNGLLLSRIDRLDETSRSVLRVASVIGQRVPFGTLQAIHSADQQVLLRLLARLDEQELTSLESSEPEQVHTFRHALLQEVAYQSMLYARRRELHGRIGAYLERRYAGHLDDYYGLLAHHYRLSDDREKALLYLLQAGQAARAVYANEEAIQHYRWALDLLEAAPEDPRAWEARDALGDVLTTIGRYDEALEQYAAILAAPGLGTDMAQRAHRKRGSAHEKQGQYNLAMEELDRAMTIARSAGPAVSSLALPTICADIALVHKRRGAYDQAIESCEQGLGAVRHDPRTREDELIEARLHSELGGIFGMRGDYPRAREHFEHSLLLRERVDDLPGMSASRNNLGYLWQLQSEYERAIEHYQIAEDLARKINLRFALIYASNNAAGALISMGKYAAAEEKSHQALRLSHELNDRHNIAQIYDTLGVIAYHKGEYDTALTCFETELHIHQNLGSQYQEANTLMNKAMVLNAQGRFAEARTVALGALDQASALNAQRLKNEVLIVLGEAALGLGDSSQALIHVVEALESSRAIDSKHDLGIALRLCGRIAAEHGQLAREYFDESISIFHAANNRFELGCTWAAYGAALARLGDMAEAGAYLKQARATFIELGANGELARLAPFLERSM